MPSLSEETGGRVSMLMPGSTIGIIGGGQLGRMMALSARYMGFRVGVLDPTPNCPTGQVADCIRLRSRTDIASFDIANDNETLFLAVGNGLLICCHSRNAELLIHGNLRFYSRNQIVCCVDNRFIELPNGLCSSFECLSVLGKCLFLYVLRHIVQHRVQTYDDRCICFFNVCNQFVNHLLTLPLLSFLIEITQLRIQSCRRIR